MWARRDIRARAAFLTLRSAHVIAACHMTALEICYSARDQKDLEALLAGQRALEWLLLAATVFAHESATFGVHVPAGAGGDVRRGCRAGVGSGCAEEAGERGDGFEQQGVEAGLLVGGAAGAEPGDGAAVLGLAGELADPGGQGGVFQGGRAAWRDAAASRG